MRDAYADVASEVPVPARDTPKHPSRRLRKSRTLCQDLRTQGRFGARRRRRWPADTASYGVALDRRRHRLLARPLLNATGGRGVSRDAAGGEIHGSRRGLVLLNSGARPIACDGWVSSAMRGK